MDWDADGEVARVRMWLTTTTMMLIMTATKEMIVPTILITIMLTIMITLTILVAVIVTIMITIRIMIMTMTMILAVVIVVVAVTVVRLAKRVMIVSKTRKPATTILTITKMLRTKLALGFFRALMIFAAAVAITLRNLGDGRNVG